METGVKGVSVPDTGVVSAWALNVGVDGSIPCSPNCVSIASERLLSLRLTGVVAALMATFFRPFVSFPRRNMDRHPVDDTGDVGVWSGELVSPFW